MKVTLTPNEGWENLNAEVKKTLALPDGVEPRAYLGLSSAIYEITMGTAQFYSHKRSLGFISGRTPHYQGLLPYFYKEGYHIQFKEEETPEKEWVDSLKKDTNLVISCEDHPVTGELYDVENLDLILNEKKIFHLRISHHAHLTRAIENRPYTARICSYNPQVAVAVMGQKFKSPPLMAPGLHWEVSAFMTQLNKVRESAKENADLIKNFESKLPAGFQAYFQHDRRLFDRSLIFADDMGGEALQQFLATQLNVRLEKPGWEDRIETTHLCRWGGTRNYEVWWTPRPPDNVLRGMVILGLEVISHPEISVVLEKSLRECRIL